MLLWQGLVNVFKGIWVLSSFECRSCPLLFLILISLFNVSSAIVFVSDSFLSMLVFLLVTLLSISVSLLLVAPLFISVSLLLVAPLFHFESIELALRFIFLSSLQFPTNLSS